MNSLLSASLHAQTLLIARAFGPCSRPRLRMQCVMSCSRQTALLLLLLLLQQLLLEKKGGHRSLGGKSVEVEMLSSLFSLSLFFCLFLIQITINCRLTAEVKQIFVTHPKTKTKIKNKIKKSHFFCWFPFHLLSRFMFTTEILKFHLHLLLSVLNELVFI